MKNKIINMNRYHLQTKVEEMIVSSYQELYRLAYSYVGNEQDALDVVQESAYKCICHAKQIHQEKYIKTWIWRVVINTAIDYSRKNSREIAVDTVTEDYLEKPYQQKQETDGIYEALAVLEEREKSIIILYYFEGFKIREIAKILEMNTNTVKSVLYRSLKKLKLKMREGGMVI